MKAARFLTAMLLTVAVVEIGFRVLPFDFDQPLEHYTEEAQLLADELDDLADAGVQSDLTFIGSSMIGRAAYPIVFESSMNGVESAHNVGLPAASAEVVDAWMNDVVVPAVSPRCVVWAVSSMDFNKHRQPSPTIDLYRSAPATRSGIRGSTGRAFRQLLSIYRHRTKILSSIELRSDTTVASRVRPLSDTADFDKSEWTSTRNEFETARVENEVLANYAISQSDVDAFASAIDRLQGEREVLVLSMAVPSSYIDRHPSPSDFDQFEAMLRAETSRAGVDLIDASDWMMDGDFHDYTHLKPNAAVEFSERLAEALNEQDFCAIG